MRRPGSRADSIEFKPQSRKEHIMDTGKTIDRRDARRTLALVLLAGGARGLRDLTNVRQARGAFWRQVPHHRFCAVELHQLGHAQHRVITQRTSPTSLLRHLQRGWSFAQGAQRVRRAAARPAARRRGNTGTRAPPTWLPEPRHHPRRILPARIHPDPGRRPRVYKMDYW